MWQGASSRSSTLQQEVPGLVGMEETLDIQALWLAGKSVSEIARVMGGNRRTIRRLIHQGAPSPRAPRLVGSKLDPFREYLLQRLLQDKGRTPPCCSTRSGSVGTRGAAFSGSSRIHCGSQLPTASPSA